MNLEQRTIEIIAQVVYKSMMEKNDTLILTKEQWELHKEQTLELARNILRVSKQINPIQ